MPRPWPSERQSLSWRQRRATVSRTAASRCASPPTGADALGGPVSAVRSAGRFATAEIAIDVVRRGPALLGDPALRGAGDVAGHPAEDHMMERRDGLPVQVAGEPARFEDRALPVHRAVAGRGGLDRQFQPGATREPHLGPQAQQPWPLHSLHAPPVQRLPRPQPAGIPPPAAKASAADEPVEMINIRLVAVGERARAVKLLMLLGEAAILAGAPHVWADVAKVVELPPAHGSDLDDTLLRLQSALGHALAGADAGLAADDLAVLERISQPAGVACMSAAESILQSLSPQQCSPVGER